MTTTAQQRPAPVLTPLLLVAIAVTILAWASAFIVIRGTGPHFSGGALALGRLVVGVLLLAIVAFRKKWVAPTRREWLQVTAFGVIWFGGYNIALNIAEKLLDAGTTAMIVNIGPILIALGAGVILRERIPRWLAIGAAVAFFGAVLISIGSGATSFGTGVGIVWCFAAAIAYAAGVLFQKPALRRLPNAQVTWMGCAIGMIVCVPFAGDLIRDLQAAPLPAILGVVYLGAVPTAIAFSTWAYALSRMPAGQLGVSTYVVPPLVIVLGLVVFGEVPTIVAIVGGAICLVGVALSRRKIRIPELVETVSGPGKSMAE